MFGYRSGRDVLDRVGITVGSNTASTIQMRVRNVGVKPWRARRHPSNWSYSISKTGKEELGALIHITMIPGPSDLLPVNPNLANLCHYFQDSANREQLSVRIR